MAFFNKLKQVGKGLTLGALDTTARLLPSLMQHKREDRLREEDRTFRREENVAADKRASTRSQKARFRTLYGAGKIGEAIALVKAAHEQNPNQGFDALLDEFESARGGVITAGLNTGAEKLAAETAAAKGADYLSRSLRTSTDRRGILESIGKTTSDLTKSEALLRHRADTSGVTLPESVGETPELIASLKEAQRRIRLIDTAELEINNSTLTLPQLDQALDSYYKAYFAATGDEAKARSAADNARSVVTSKRAAMFLNRLSAYTDPDQLIADAVTMGITGTGAFMTVDAYAQTLQSKADKSVSERERADRQTAMDLYREAQRMASSASAREDKKLLDASMDMMLDSARLFEKLTGQETLANSILRDPGGHLRIGVPLETPTATIVREWVNLGADYPEKLMKILGMYGTNVRSVEELTALGSEGLANIARTKVLGLDAKPVEERDIPITDIADNVVEKIQAGGDIDHIAGVATDQITDPTDQEAMAVALLERGYLMDFEEGSLMAIPWSVSDIISSSAIKKILTDPKEGKTFLSSSNDKYNFLRSPEARRAVSEAIISDDFDRLALTGGIVGATAYAGKKLFTRNLTPKQRQLLERNKNLKNERDLTGR